MKSAKLPCIDFPVNNKTLKRELLGKKYPGHIRHIENAFEAGQTHVFRWWDEITPSEKKNLLDQIAIIDFSLIKKLFNEAVLNPTQTTQNNLTPPQIIAVPKNDAEKEIAYRAKRVGENSLQKGEVAILTVAGGDGTRLGISGPKGTFPITPITRKSIFQLHAEKIIAAQKRYNTRIPWYIMTSKNNDSATQNFFKAHKFFGLNQDQICFFTQGMFPVVDLEGKVLMDSKSSIMMSPNGHGGALVALKEQDVLNDMNRRGIRNIFYHQVDNVLIKIADPVFIGYHVRDAAEISLKVVKKCHPEEKVGIVVYIDGNLHMIEYSELSRKDMCAKNEDGTLKYHAGNIAVHMINISFLERVYQKEEPLPYHAAIKKVPYLGEDGNVIDPKQNNAIKFESFIFDLLRHVKKSVIMEVLREDEFSPIKNMEGENSPATSRQDMINQFGQWLRGSGVSIPTDSHGNVIGSIEISPGFALDEEELKNKVDKQLQFNGKLLL
ncbi:MAG: UDP-N-acetylglucosamine pyrophosphorylase [Candidatus Brocadia sp. WS118]|nr:MAG: UDP-N-acetylglucosamine pyrophosphorylase [Candidatus Brocadia sp. WS118]